jgi:Leucine-rich repeat (LRR) protein
MSIKKAIIDKNEGNEVEKSEYVNLILDDMNLGPEGTICEEDRTFLEGFTETQYLSLNSTGLKTLANLPAMPKLERLELCDNKIHATLEDLSRLSTLYPELRILKLSNNQIKSLEDVTTALLTCPKLESLDLTNNPCVGEDQPAYTKLVRDLLPKL